MPPPCSGMKLFVDRKNRRFVKSAASNVVLDRLVLKRRDLLPVEVVFVENGAVVAAQSGTGLTVALKQSFGDANYLALAEAGVLNLNTVPLEAAFDADPLAVAAYLEVRWTATGETTRTATLQVEIQNSVILGTEGTPAAIPDGKATQAEAEAGTDNDHWMTPLRTKQAIAAVGGVTSYNDLTDTPTLGTAAATASTDYATAAQGAKADTALQPAPVTYLGEYNNGLSYNLGVVVKFNGSLYIRVSNPLNPGYPPGHSSWDLFEAEVGSPAYDLWVQSALESKQAAGSYAPASDISPSAITGTAVVTSDPRLSDSRQPTSHKSTHITGGTDALTPADIGAAASSHSHPLSQLEQSSATNGQVPVWDATTTAWVPQTPTSGGIPTANIQFFNSVTGSNTWTKPANAKSVNIQLVGGGGGGGSGRKGAAGSPRSGGGGGGGAGVTFFQVDASTLPNAPATVSVVIGAGGLGGASQATNSTNGIVGADGGETTFGIFRARGGFGGTGGTATTAAGGAGGPAQCTGGS